MFDDLYTGWGKFGTEKCLLRKDFQYLFKSSYIVSPNCMFASAHIERSPDNGCLRLGVFTPWNLFWDQSRVIYKYTLEPQWRVVYKYSLEPRELQCFNIRHWAQNAWFTCPASTRQVPAQACLFKTTETKWNQVVSDLWRENLVHMFLSQNGVVGVQGILEMKNECISNKGYSGWLRNARGYAWDLAWQWATTQSR